MRRSAVPGPDKPRKLALYKYDSCPYCMRVMWGIQRLNLDVPTRDTRQDPSARSELVSATGGTQVPCLFIDDVPLLESADILQWLEAYAKAGGKR